MEVPSSADEDEKCAICLEIPNKPVKLPCNHSFCSSCLEGWRNKHDFESDRKCPTCRGKVPPTKEMVAQLKLLRELDEELRAIMLDPSPIPVPKLPGYPGYENFKASAATNLHEDFVREINNLDDPEEQQLILRSQLERRIKHNQETVAKLEDILAESDQILEEHDDAEDLPVEISWAVKNKDIKSVLEWLGPTPVPDQRLNAKCRSHRDNSLMYYATCMNDLNLMRLLLQMGARVDPKSVLGITPLVQACVDQRLEEAAHLLLTWGAISDEPVGALSLSGGESPRDYALKDNSTLGALMQTPLGGRRCEIVGLKKSRTNLNGTTGVATKYLPKHDCYVVHVEQTDEKVQVRPTNLQRRDRMPEDCGKVLSYQRVKKEHLEEEQIIFSESLCIRSKEEEELPLARA